MPSLILRVAACVSLLAATLSSMSLPAVAAQDKAVRIGFQKSSTLLTILKSRGTLEAGLKPLGVGDMERVHQRAAAAGGAQCRRHRRLRRRRRHRAGVRAGRRRQARPMSRRKRPRPSAQAIVVPADSPITSVAELKGKKVAVTKAAGVHYLLIAALEKAGPDLQGHRAGLSDARRRPRRARERQRRRLGDVGPVPGGGPAAGQGPHPRRRQGVADYQRYYLAAAPSPRPTPQVIALIFDALQNDRQMGEGQPGQAAALLAPLWGLDAGIVDPGE